MAGKGDKQRPREVDKKVFEDNWDRIFKKKKENPLPFSDAKPNEKMFEDMNLNDTKETGDNKE